MSLVARLLLALCVLAGPLWTAAPAAAVVPGFDSAYAGESAFLAKAAGESGQFSAIFTNVGATAWTRGQIGLLACRDDKTTCNVAPEEAAYATSWYSSTAYATVAADAAPGQNAFFIYNFTVPVGTPPGTSAVFNGDVGIIATGQLLRPEGYFQINRTPPGPVTLLGISPSPGAVRVGGTIPFTPTNVPAGAVVTFRLEGGCGAITSDGLFVATATNAGSQPCAAVVSAGGQTARAPITVFGSPTSISCAVTPASLIANGTSTATVTGTLKDANGNAVSDDAATAINFANITFELITPIGNAVVTPSSGVASRTYTTTTTAGEAQVSLSLPGLQGCNVIFTTRSPGIATQTAAVATPATIGADGASTSQIRVSVQDASGNTVIGDSITNITLDRRSTSTAVCGPASLGPQVVTGGVITFTVTSTTTPGTCAYDVRTNHTQISGTSVAITTQSVGAPAKIAVVSSTSPQSVNTQITVVAEVRDQQDRRVTDPSFASQTIRVDHTCSGLLPNAGTTFQSSSSGPDAGRLTVTLSSTTAMSGCPVSFNGASGMLGSSTPVTYTPGPNDRLSCSFAPGSITSDGVSQSIATVRVIDAFGNATNTGTYSTSFTRTSGGVTTLLTTSPRQMAAGAAQFTVRSTTTAGQDTFTATANVNGVPGDESASCSITT